MLAVLTVVLAVFALTAGSRPLTVVALVLMGAFGFATVPGLQMRIMTYAGRPRPWRPARTSPPSTSATRSVPGSAA